MQADNIKDGKRVAVMHGENFFVPIDALPDGEVKLTNTWIAGHSETGHHHVLESTADMQVNETERAVLLVEVGKLFHKKSFDVHETKFLAPGAYRVLHKTEYDPFQKVVRRVWD